MASTTERGRPDSAGSTILTIPRRGRDAALATLVLAGMAPMPGAAQWTFEPRAELQTVLTDNVTLQPRDDARSDVVLVAAPGFALRREDDRLDLALDYTLQGIVYTELSDGNQVFHQASAQVATELVQDALFVNVNGAVFQQVVDPETPFILNNIVQTGNRTDTLLADVGVTYRESLGDVAEVDASYTYGAQTFSESELVSSRFQNARLRIENPAFNQGATWALDMDYTRVDYDGPLSEIELGSVGGELGYWVSNNIRLFAGVGAESDFFAHSDRVELDVATWLVGLEWRVADRDQLRISYGRRVFGNTVNGTWSHRLGEFFTLDIDYTEQPSTNALLLRNIRFESPVDFDDDQGLDRPGDPDVFVARRFSSGITLRGNRTTISLRGFAERRDNRVTLGEDPTVGVRDQRALGVAANARRSVGANTTLEGAVSFETADFGDDATTDRWTASLALRYALGTRTDLELRAQRFDGGSNTVELTENRVGLTLARRFY